MERIYRSTEPFVLPGTGEMGEVAVLLIHGFTGSPAEYRRLAYSLNDAGYSVHALLLPGHGTTPEEMLGTGWRDWWGHVLRTYDEIRDNYRRIVAVGFSMGGLLALRLSVERPVDGVVCLSAPIYLQSKKTILAVLLRYFVKYVEKKPTVAQEILDNACAYRKTPVSCVVSLRKLIRMTRSMLFKVNAPIFIAQGLRDGTVVPRSASYIYERVMSGRKTIKFYPASSHAILLDADHEQLYGDIHHFIGSLMQRGADALVLSRPNYT